MTDEEFTNKSNEAQRVTQMLLTTFKQTGLDEIDIYNAVLKALVSRNDKADPWKAVQRIKEKHKSVMMAAVTVINVYKWQGAQQPQFFAEAMAELEKAVAALTTFPLSNQQPQSREDG